MGFCFQNKKIDVILFQHTKFDIILISASYLMLFCFWCYFVLLLHCFTALFADNEQMRITLQTHNTPALISLVHLLLYLEYSAGCTVHYFRYKHRRPGAQATVRLLLFVLLVLTVKVVALTVETSTMIRHFTRDPELFRYGPVQFFAGLVQYFGALPFQGELVVRCGRGAAGLLG